MTQMNNLDALADQIYQEGIEKATRESERMLAAARQKAQVIVEEAKTEATNRLNEAKAKVTQLESRAMNEIQVKSKQALSDLRTDIETVLLANSLNSPTTKLFAEKEFLKELILTLSSQWRDDDEHVVTVPADLLEEIQKYLSGMSKKKLDGLVLNPSPRISGGFTVDQTEKGYYLSFTDEDFIEFLTPYFSEQLQQILFD